MATPWIRRSIVGATSALIVGAVLVHGAPPRTVAAKPIPPRPLIADGIQKIKHVIVVMQENRSFDNYFGTSPGADGIPRQGGRPTVCIPDPDAGHCLRPFHDSHLIDLGGPHTARAARADINGGRMDGFVQTLRAGRQRLCVVDPREPGCGASSRARIPDVMGYHTASEIPNYWSYAHRFVLQDHLFEGVRSWSLPSHLDLVSGWSARCSDPHDPMTCSTYLGYRRDAIERAEKQLRRPRAAVRVDRSHLSPARSPRELALLRGERQPAGLRRWADGVSSSTAVGLDTGHLEPAPRLPDGLGRPPDLRRPAGRFLLPGREGWDAPVGLLDRAQRPAQRTPSELDRCRAGVGDADRERGDAQPRLEQHGDLLIVG